MHLLAFEARGLGQALPFTSCMSLDSEPWVSNGLRIGVHTLALVGVNADSDQSISPLEETF
jgi:hypothetical protein